MDKIWDVMGITLWEGIRNRALQGILLLALLLCVAFLVIIPLFSFETGKVMVDLGFSAMSLAGLAIVFFLGIAMLTEDIHRRTICMILARPISRSQYFLGKYLGLAIIILAAVLIVAGVAIFFSWIGIRFIPSMVPPRNFAWSILATGILFNYLALLVLMSVAFLFVIVTTSTYLSMLITFCVYIIGHSLETISKMIASGEFLQAGGAYAMVLKLLSWFLPNLSAFDLKLYLAHGLPLSPATCGWTILYGVFYIGAVIFISIQIFERKEIK